MTSIILHFIYGYFQKDYTFLFLQNYCIRIVHYELYVLLYILGNTIIFYMFLFNNHMHHLSFIYIFIILSYYQFTACDFCYYHSKGICFFIILFKLNVLEHIIFIQPINLKESYIDSNQFFFNFLKNYKICQLIYQLFVTSLANFSILSVFVLYSFRRSLFSTKLIKK